MKRCEASDEASPAQRRKARKCGVCVDEEMTEEEGGGDARKK